MQFVELNLSSYNSFVEQGISVIVFWAPWSEDAKDCLNKLTTLDTIIKDPSIKYFKVNEDEEKPLSVKCGVRMVPSIIIIKDGIIEKRMLGKQSARMVADEVNKIIGDV